MSDLHHHHDTAGTTVIREDVDREGPATALIVLLILAFVGFLIWLFAFSGVIFQRGGGSSTINNRVTNEQPVSPDSSSGTQGSSAPSAS